MVVGVLFREGGIRRLHRCLCHRLVDQPPTALPSVGLSAEFAARAWPRAMLGSIFGELPTWTALGAVVVSRQSPRPVSHGL